jgi:outer membrane protein
VVALDQAREQVTQSDFTLAISQQDLIIRTTVAYFDVLLAEFNVELAEQQKIAVAEQLAQAKRNFEVGTATITDTNEAQAKYDQIIATEIQARNDLDRRRTALAAIVGKMPKTLSASGAASRHRCPSPTRGLGGSRSGKTCRCGSSQSNCRSQHSRSTARRSPAQLDLVASANALTNSGSTTGGSAAIRPFRAVRVVLSVPIYGRLRQLTRARDHLPAGQGARRPEAAKRSATNARTAFRRQQRGGRGQGVRAGGGVGGSRAAVNIWGRDSASAPTSTC